MPTNKELVRGDSYAVRRPLYTITLVDADGDPFDLRSCTIRSTFKTAPTDPVGDPTDTTAAIKHYIVIDGAGAVTANSGLFLSGPATGGVLHQRMTAAQTRVMPINQPLFCDIKLIDGSGEVFSWIMEDSITFINGFTNRLVD